MSMSRFLYIKNIIVYILRYVIYFYLAPAPSIQLLRLIRRAMVYFQLILLGVQRLAIVAAMPLHLPWRVQC